MKCNELKTILSSRQIDAIEHILTNEHYDLWVYTVLYHLSGKTITDIGECNEKKDKYAIPKKVKCICPYCGGTERRNLIKEQILPEYDILIAKLDCRRCETETTFDLIATNSVLNEKVKWKVFTECYISPYPKSDQSVAPEEVEEDLRQDYREAYLCLDISPRASAALSRYCLEKIITLNTEFKEETLFNKINKLIDTNSLPTYISKLLHAVRQVGNYGVHPCEDQNTGLIVDVNHEEAEWLLEIITGLFDFYYVKPAKEKENLKKLDEKLESMKKKKT